MPFLPQRQTHCFQMHQMGAVAILMSRLIGAPRTHRTAIGHRHRASGYAFTGGVRRRRAPVHAGIIA